MEEGTFHLIKPKHYDSECKKKVNFCPALGSEQSVNVP